MTIDEYAALYSDGHWLMTAAFIGLPPSRRMRTLLAEVQRALEANDKALAMRWIKVIVKLLHTDGLIPETTEDSKYEIEAADSAAKIAEKIITGVITAMKSYETKGDPDLWTESDDSSVGTREMMDIADEMEGTIEDFGPIELDFGDLMSEADDIPGSQDNDPPPSDHGGAAPGGGRPGGGGGGAPGNRPSGGDAPNGGGTPPPPDDDNNRPPKGKDQDKAKSEASKKTAKGGISALDVEKAAMAIAELGKDGAREIAARLAADLIDDGNGFPLPDLADEILRRATVYLREQTARQEEEIRLEKEKAEKKPATEQDARAAETGGSAAEAPAGATADVAEGDTDAAAAGDTLFADYEDQINEIDFALVTNDPQTARRLAAKLAGLLAMQQGEFSGLSADDILRRVSEHQQRRNEAGAARNAELGVAATMDEVWESVAFQAARQRVLAEDAADRTDEAQRLLAEALGIARNTAQNLGITDKVSARDVLNQVFPAERMQDFDRRVEAERDAVQEDTRPNTMDRVQAERTGDAKSRPGTMERMQEEIRGSDSRGPQTSFDIPERAVLPVLWALTNQDENAARDAARKAAERLRKGDENAPSVEEIAAELLKRAKKLKSEDDAQTYGRDSDPGDSDPGDSDPGGNAGGVGGGHPFLQHVTDVPRFLIFDRLFRQVSEMDATEPRPEALRKANALVKTFREQKELFTDGAKAAQFIDFCIHQARLQSAADDSSDEADSSTDTSDDGSWPGSGSPEPDGRDDTGSDGGSTGHADLEQVDHELHNNPALMTHLEQAAQLWADNKMKDAAVLAQKIAAHLRKKFNLSIQEKELLGHIIKKVAALEKKINPRKNPGSFTVALALNEYGHLQDIFMRIVAALSGTPDKKAAVRLAMALAKEMIKTYGTDDDPTTIAKEILKLAEAAAKRASDDSTQDSGSTGSDDGSDKRPPSAAGGSDTSSSDMTPGRPPSGEVTVITQQDVKQTDWKSVSSLYFGEDESAKDMQSIATAIVKKGAGDPKVEKSAKDLLAKSKKTKKGNFKNFRHIIAAVVDAVTKKANGKKVAKTLKASEMPDDEDKAA